MKTKIAIIVFCIVGILQCWTGKGFAAPVTIEMRSAGTLAQNLGNDGRATIKDLKIVGPLNGSDLLVLREMAGKNAQGEKTEGALECLDLSEATIVAGGQPYFKKYVTENHVIGAELFAFTTLVKVVLPATVTRIGSRAFVGCKRLTDVSLPRDLRTMDEMAFYKCTHLLHIMLPAQLEQMGEAVFGACTELAAYEVMPGNTHFSAHQGILYDASRQVLLACPLGKSGYVRLPENIVRIASRAFAGCTQIWGISFGIAPTLTTIEDFAFRGCTDLGHITLPEGLKKIGRGAFMQCKELYAVDFPTGLEEIGYESFSSTSLSKVDLEQVSTLKHLEGDAFRNCRRLESVILPASLETVGDYAFDGCTELARLEVFAVRPPVVSGNAFMPQTYAACRVTVPEQCEEVYRSDEVWNRFVHLEASLPTGVQQVVRAQPSTYYNMEGRASSRPHQGWNVVRSPEGKSVKCWYK